jgi:hypothetical protein
MMENTVDANSSVAIQTAISFPPIEEKLIGNRYRVAEVLRDDRDGDLLLAADSVVGNSVAIRRLPAASLSADARLRMEREAKVLAKLQSSWLSGVLELFQDGDQLCLVRPYVQGTTLRQRLLRGPLDLVATLTVGRCLLSALKLVHAEGVLHHDIRPANLIINDHPILKKAILTDFSLGCHANLGTWDIAKSLETARYGSPEHAGSVDYDLDATSDLYSVGIVLFECLSGRVPFGGDTVGEILLAHMTSRVPDLRSLGLDIPRSLDEVIQRLLRKDPRDRYQTAEAVLLDLEEIATSLQSGVLEPSLVVGSHDRRPTLTEPAFVGRRDELEQLEQQIWQVAAGESSLVFIEAESGGGKSRLLAELTVRGVQAGMWVLRGRGSEMVGQMPFHVLNGIVENVIAESKSDPSLAQALCDRLGDHLNAVAAILPDLAQALGWETSIPIGPDTFVETRSVQALAAFLSALSTDARPAMIILDD